ncbi:Cleavage stimulation factor subunit 2 [Coemansia spiralis]|uniref:Cleavage stimulation factor subunit 2 n=1 Tax=Coemansia spiralis TaxID=417178 RepID=A0A9W8L1I3_9FUNG|nr:Cleavage stimulation factor subunit 2 [Coemansia spiralis]
MEHWIEGPESNIVFLGNVGFETTEEQLRKVLELAGPVLEIRLVFDPTTNRSRGFGFCQFIDSSVAASAIKNLSDTLIDGRNIKMGFADKERVYRYFGNNAWSTRGGADSVAKVVEALEPTQRAELLAQFKSFASVNTTKAREELVKNPALAHALLCALESLGSMDRDSIARIKGTAQRTSGGLGGVSRGMSAGYSPRQTSSASMSPVTPVHRPMAPAMPTHRSMAPQPRQPSPAPVPQSAPAGPEPMEMDNAELFQQVLSLTDEQLSMMPEEHRQQMIDLRRQLQGSLNQ